MGVLYYVIHDPSGQLRSAVLRVYELQVGQYQLRPDTFLPVVGLGLTLWTGSYEGKLDTWLRWCDASGAVIPTGAERATEATERERQATERERQAAARAERLAARLRALGLEPEVC
ncbi:MAG: hypothetical protein AB7N91_23300 [Candidatus Tectimicrobiota bacterium]